MTREELLDKIAKSQCKKPLSKKDFKQFIDELKEE